MDSEVLQQAIDYFGKDKQIRKAIEEMAELITELARAERAMNVNIIEEIADVTIMIQQLSLIFGSELVNHQVSTKMRRLKNLIQDNFSG